MTRDGDDAGAFVSDECLAIVGGCVGGGATVDEVLNLGRTS